MTYKYGVEFFQKHKWNDVLSKNKDDKQISKGDDAPKGSLAKVFDLEAERRKRQLPQAPKSPFAPGFQLISK
jgi:hypothetical protein